MSYYLTFYWPSSIAQGFFVGVLIAVVLFLFALGIRWKWGVWAYVIDAMRVSSKDEVVTHYPPAGRMFGILPVIPGSIFVDFGSGSTLWERLWFWWNHHPLMANAMLLVLLLGVHLGMKAIESRKNRRKAMINAITKADETIDLGNGQDPVTALQIWKQGKIAAAREAAKPFAGSGASQVYVVWTRDCCAAEEQCFVFVPDNHAAPEQAERLNRKLGNAKTIVRIADTSVSFWHDELKNPTITTDRYLYTDLCILAKKHLPDDPKRPGSDDDYGDPHPVHDICC